MGIARNGGPLFCAFRKKWNFYLYPLPSLLPGIGWGVRFLALRQLFWAWQSMPLGKFLLYLPKWIAGTVHSASQYAKRVMLKRKIVRFNPDVVYSNTICNQDLLRHLNLDVPVVTHVRELEGEVNSFYGLNNPHRIYSSNKYLIVCENQRAMLEKMGVLASVISLVPVAVDPEFIRGQSLQPLRQIFQDLRESVGFLVIGCGSLSNRKGVMDFILIAAACKLLDSGKDIKFVWLGDGDRKFFEGEVMYRGLKNAVDFISPEENPYPLFKAADLFLMTSFEDPCPRVMLESCVCGTPVMALTCSGGVADFILGSGGELINRNDPRICASLVRHMSDDLQSLRRTCIKEIRYVETHHLLSDIAMTLERHLAAAASEHGNGY